MILKIWSVIAGIIKRTRMGTNKELCRGRPQRTSLMKMDKSKYNIKDSYKVLHSQFKLLYKMFTGTDMDFSILVHVNQKKPLDDGKVAFLKVDETTIQDVILDEEYLYNSRTMYTPQATTVALYSDAMNVYYDFRPFALRLFANFISFSGDLILRGRRDTSYLFEQIIARTIDDYAFSRFRLSTDFLMALSASTYEKAYLKNKVYISIAGVDRGKRHDDLILKFDEEIKFSMPNLRRVRKLLELNGNALVVGKELRIKGFTDTEAREYEGILELNGFLSWSLTFEGNKIVYRNGIYRLSNPQEEDQPLPEGLRAAIKELYPDQEKKLIEAITEAAKQEHGTVVIFGTGEDVLSESKRLRSRGTAIKPRKLNNNIIRMITSVDGAVLMDSNLTCRLFGVILDGDTSDAGTPARGARYNSTVTYVKRRAQFGQCFIGVIISEDGTIDWVDGRNAIAATDA